MKPSPPSQDKEARALALAWVEAIWKEIRTHLQVENQKIYEEIKNYPRPIPACDLQFNRLLEDRASITQELDRLERASREIVDAGDPIQFIDEYIESLKHIDDAAKKIISASMREKLSDLRG